MLQRSLLEEYRRLYLAQHGMAMSKEKVLSRPIEAQVHPHMFYPQNEVHHCLLRHLL
ncbi:MAG: hypothetical protein Q9M11_06430 [Mariprofundaceae bacterium]|nr:hypothetical protein [Mariprofundaceae bacterium]